METKTISLLLLAVSSYGLYKMYFEKTQPQEVAEKTSSGGVTSNADLSSTGKKTKTQSTIKSTNLDNIDDDFKVQIYKDNYKSYKKTSSNSKSKKRTYTEISDNVTVVKDNNKIVGGYDFNKKMSLTKKTASSLDKNKNNPIVKIAWGL